MIKKMISLFTFTVSFFTTQAQVNKAPAYPLITHDPYFSIWSTTDKLNESTTKHWTGRDHSLLGFLSVDGKLYKFLGEPAKELKALVADADFQSYSCRYTETKPGTDWLNADYDDSKWQTGQGIFGTKDAGSKTIWTSREIWIRRVFDLQSVNINELLLKIKYDDNVEIYLNGEKIFNAGCCSANKEVLLSKAIEQKLRKGKNVLAIYCENTGGQAYIDAGLYDRLPPEPIQNALQRKVEITATQTKYAFYCGPVFLNVDFLSPLLMNDLDLYSRPVTFVTFNVMTADDDQHDVKLFFGSSEDLARNRRSQEVKTGFYKKDGIAFQRSGTVEQAILKRKGDDVRIDWGYSYLATADASSSKLSPNKRTDLTGLCNLEINCGKIRNVPVEKTILLAYDDLYSIQYFGQNLQAWWKKNFSSAEQMIKRSLDEFKSIEERCNNFDKQLYDDAVKAGDNTYADLCVLAYRQSLAAHKLVRGPNNEILFPQKEK